MKTIASIAAAALVAAAISVPAPASARDRGGAVAAGVIGGLAAGAIIGSAVSQPRYYGPPPAPVYVEPAPVYVAPPPYEAECRLERQRVWDGYAYRTRRVEVCD